MNYNFYNNKNKNNFTSIFRLLLILLFFSFVVSAQNDLISKYASQNVTFFNRENNGFRGAGWEKISGEAGKANYVLIGEDHFTREIPFFVSVIAKHVKFDNFIGEVDPFSASFLSTKVQNLSPAKLDKYVLNYGNTFSFFALKPEFELMRQMIQSKTKVFGTDQIVINADRLMASELKMMTKNPQAKEIYEEIESQSKISFDKFLENPSVSKMYMLSPDFEKNLQTLSSLKLSAQETEIISALKISLRIYKEKNHLLRVQLMKKQLLKNFEALKNGKSLFKFGANHLASGESLLKIYDIGNLVSNVADSRFEKSLHIMIVGKSGTQGSPFKGFPAANLDPENGELSFLKPFFQTVKGESWHCFDLPPIRRAVEKGSLQITDQKLLRTIKGYDYLIVIPTVSAAGF